MQNGLCRCGCGATARTPKGFYNKEHHLTWMRNGGAREVNACLPREVRVRGGKTAGRKLVESGKLAQAGLLGAGAGGKANAAKPGHMKAIGALQSREGKAAGGRIAGRLAVVTGRLALAGLLGAIAGGRANAAVPGRMKALNARQSREAKARGGRNAALSRVRRRILQSNDDAGES